MLLSAQSITKSFPGAKHPVLKDVDFALQAKEIVALTGESGSGKSTLLHIVAGLEMATSGSIEIEGEPLTNMPDAARAKLRRTKIGIVFQQFNLIPSLTVAKNLSFQAELVGQRPSQSDIRTLAEKLGLEDHLAKYPEELSGGQQQRVAIGRALFHRPKLVLADEPTGNLDEATAAAVFGVFLKAVAERNAGLLLVTHSEKLAAMAHRRLHLSHGTLET